MTMKVDWEKLRVAYQDIVNHGELTGENDIVFLMVLSNGKSKKAIVKLKELMQFMWSLSESKELNILTLIIQDKEGRILYRHKQRTSGEEEIPDGGHAAVIQHWETLTRAEKDTYIEMLVAQIQTYEL